MPNKYPNDQSNPASALPVWTAIGLPLGYAQLTDMTDATSLTVPNGSTRVLLRAEAQNVRWRDDGTAPTADEGMLILPDDPPFLYGGDITAIQFIAAAEGAILNVSFY